MGIQTIRSTYPAITVPTAATIHGCLPNKALPVCVRAHVGIRSSVTRCLLAPTGTCASYRIVDYWRTRDTGRRTHVLKKQAQPCAGVLLPPLLVVDPSSLSAPDGPPAAETENAGAQSLPAPDGNRSSKAPLKLVAGAGSLTEMVSEMLFCRSKASCVDSSEKHGRSSPSMTSITMSASDSHSRSTLPSLFA
eukprot:CAMPEP_0113721046 /NCGR_PEP_ID=MMETSP0038_2-20120614/36874_1 /TAXON_ID=2898 /ORGANISM="Cryptomonas paramecium" /LENGTH=191 /DNA_ID=CAMNT_0000649929 /DNA_START=470 /DNA_END=1043 /DNA_ORIENTATION=- /assembly_acc=CAM_ASM_000170